MICSFIVMSIFSFSQGIIFEENGLAKNLAKAKKENKLIFLDAYTSWCAPCKLMAKNIFPLSSVGEYYNTNFINLKIDMEKGEGLQIAKKYGIRSFPTYLFFNSDGEIVHRYGSSLSEQEFLQLGKDAKDPAKQFPLLKKKFENGEKDSEFLKTAILAFLRSGDSELAEKALDEYLKQKNDFTKEDLNLVISTIYSNPGGKYRNFFRDRKSDILQLISEERYNSYAENFDINYIVSISTDKKTKKFNENIFLAEAEKLYGKEKSQQLLLKQRTYIAFNTKDYSTYEKLVLDIYQDPSQYSSSELNTIAWNFYEHVDHIESLHKAIIWAEESVKKNENYSNSDTLAHLYHKIGDRENAKKWAEKALQAAGQEGKSASETEKLLKSLQ